MNRVSRQRIAAFERPRSLWRNRDYLLLWGGQTVSTAGSQASQLALPLLILAVTGSPAQAGLLGGLRGFAYLLFGLPAGPLVDRWDRKRVMVLCDVGRALAFASIPLALLVGHVTAAQLYAVSFVEGTLYIFFGLAETACLTRVAPAAQLPTAVSQNQATDSASTLVGPPLGGALFGIAHALPFVADSVSYAISALSVLFIRTPLQEARVRDERTQPRRSLLAEAREGARWIRERPVLHLLMWLDGGLYLVYGGWSLVVIELVQRHGGSAAATGLIFASGGAGAVLGSILTPLGQRRFGVGPLVIGIAWIFALSWPPYALAPNLLILGAVNCIGFFVVPVIFSTEFSYRLLLVPDALQGRVNSLFRLVSFGGQTLGFLLTGVLLEWYGPVATVWITLAPALGVALLATLSGSLRRVGHLAPAAQSEAGGAQ